MGMLPMIILFNGFLSGKCAKDKRRRLEEYDVRHLFLLSLSRLLSLHLPGKRKGAWLSLANTVT